MTVFLTSSWKDLNTPHRWRQWLDIAAMEDPDSADWWSDLEGCHGCQYLDEINIWCKRVEKPATRNPILDMLGMACCGAGYKKVPPRQLSLWS